MRLYSRNRLPQQLPGHRRRHRRACRPRADPRRRGHLGRPDLPRVRRAVARRPRGDGRCRSTSGARGWRRCRCIRRWNGWSGSTTPIPGSARRGGLGRGDRQAPRFALRAPPLAALAEDEDSRRPATWWSAASPIPRAAASAWARCWSASSRGRTWSSPARSAPASTRRCCSTCAPGSTPSALPASPFTRATGLPRRGAHWVRPEIVVQVAFIEWTGHGKLRHPRLLAVRA